MKFLTKNLWLLFISLLVCGNCSDCTEKKPTSSQQQPTPIQGTPDIPPAPPADESPATPQSPPENPISDFPGNPIPSSLQSPEKTFMYIVIQFNFRPDFSKRLIVKNALTRRVIDVFKKNKIENCYLLGFDYNLNLNDERIYEILDRAILLIDDKMSTHVFLGLHKDESKKLIDLSRMFWSTYSNHIRSIHFFDFPTLRPKNTMGMFMECANLDVLRLPEIDYSNLQDCSLMFQGCSKLTLEGTNLTKQDISALDNRLFQLDPMDKSDVFYNCPLGKHFNNI